MKKKVLRPVRSLVKKNEALVHSGYPAGRLANYHQAGRVKQMIDIRLECLRVRQIRTRPADYRIEKEKALHLFQSNSILSNHPRSASYHLL